jgi:hypothetical protein
MTKPERDKRRSPKTRQTNPQYLVVLALTASIRQARNQDLARAHQA